MNLSLANLAKIHRQSSTKRAFTVGKASSFLSMSDRDLSRGWQVIDSHWCSPDDVQRPPALRGTAPNSKEQHNIKQCVCIIVCCSSETGVCCYSSPASSPNNLPEIWSISGGFQVIFPASPRPRPCFRRGLPVPRATVSPGRIPILVRTN